MSTICVSIGRGRHSHVVAEHQQLVARGAKLVELRLDYIKTAVDLKRLLDNRPCPVVITCRRQPDGGRFPGNEDARRTLLRAAIAAGVEYVDLEEDVAASIKRYGKTKRIISFHDFQRTPDDLLAIHQRLSKFDPDIVKIATLAHRPHDNVRMLRLIEQSRIPTVGLCMGDIGTPSRILAGKFGSPFTYATFHHERELAPGQLSFDQMKDIYDYENITSTTEIYGVIGDPIGHSLSPHIHNAAFRAQSLNKVYVPFRVPREFLDEFLSDARELGIRGLSVTIPHKEGAFERLTHPDPETAAIGATNTVIFDGSERQGYNTDCRAAIDALEKVMGPIRAHAALVLGAGGAAQALAFGLKQRGARVTIASRTLDRAERLANQLKCRAVEWGQRYTVNPDILVNCTPLGMHPNVNETPYDKHHIKPGIAVLDTVYNPENTLLIKDARVRSCQVVTGTEMFIRQAALQYQLFTGGRAPDGVMLAALKRHTGAVKE